MILIPSNPIPLKTILSHIQSVINRPYNLIHFNLKSFFSAKSKDHHFSLTNSNGSKSVGWARTDFL
jgi:hypothetical protein